MNFRYLHSGFTRRTSPDINITNDALAILEFGDENIQGSQTDYWLNRDPSNFKSIGTRISIDKSSNRGGTLIP